MFQLNIQVIECDLTKILFEQSTKFLNKKGVFPAYTRTLRRLGVRQTAYSSLTT